MYKKKCCYFFSPSGIDTVTLLFLLLVFIAVIAIGFNFFLTFK